MSGEQVCHMQNHDCLIHHDNAPVQTALSVQEFLVTINKICLIWPFAVSSSFKNKTAAILVVPLLRGPEIQKQSLTILFRIPRFQFHKYFQRCRNAGPNA
jgi:hypothetical protein